MKSKVITARQIENPFRGKTSDEVFEDVFKRIKESISKEEMFAQIAEARKAASK